MAARLENVDRTRTQPTALDAREVQVCNVPNEPDMTFLRALRMANRIAATRSSSAIQLMNCVPLPSRPPRPSRNGGSMRDSAPPLPLSTTPILRLLPLGSNRSSTSIRLHDLPPFTIHPRLAFDIRLVLHPAIAVGHINLPEDSKQHLLRSWQ